LGGKGLRQNGTRHRVRGRAIGRAVSVSCATCFLISDSSHSGTHESFCVSTRSVRPVLRKYGTAKRFRRHDCRWTCPGRAPPFPYLTRAGRPLTRLAPRGPVFIAAAVRASAPLVCRKSLRFRRMPYLRGRLLPRVDTLPSPIRHRGDYLGILCGACHLFPIV